jgi:4-amino-4-deoxy-L-arabinose transferase-like glycosyltransferase
MLPPLLAVASVLVATTHGVGISPDSVAYVGAARNLLAGEGLSLPFGSTLHAPLTHFPPLYSLLLATGDLFGLEPFMWARWLQALLTGSLIFLVGYALHCYAGPKLAIVGSTLFVLSPTLLSIATMAWTETLFLGLSLAALLLLTKLLEEWQWRTFFAAALLAGAALLTRYAGIALIVTGGLALVILSQRSLWQRLWQASTFAFVSLLPLSLWLVRNMTLAGNATNRTLAYHPPDTQQIVQALDTLSGWLFVPPTMPSEIKILVPALPLLLIVIALFLPRNDAGQLRIGVSTTLANQQRMMHVLILFAVTYTLFLLGSITWIDANTPLDARILSPLYLTILLLTLLAAARVLNTIEQKPLLSRAIGATIAMASLLLALLMLRQSSQLVQDYAREGIGLAAVAWQHSEMVALVEELPSGQAIYTNAPEALYFLTGRSALSIPRKINVMAQRPNAEYAAEVETMRQELAAGGLFIYFTTLGRSSLAQQRELQTELGLVLVVEVDDGAIYQIATSTETASPN